MKISVGDKEYKFEAGKILNVEFIAIEKKTGYSVDEFEARLEAGSMMAVTALIWILRKRQEPTLKFEDVEFEIGEISMTQDEDEEETEGKAPMENDLTPAE